MEYLKSCAKARDASIELYRVFLMFGICLQHCVCQGLWRTDGFPKNILCACVPGFVFISGWFGVRFSLSKLVRLYSVPVYASLLAPLCGCAWVGGGGGGYWQEVIRVWHADGGFWFIHAYAVLMILAPMVNVVLLRSSSIKESTIILVPVIAMSLLWGALRHYRCFCDYVPSTPGLESGSGLTLMGIYCLGRLLRIGEVESRLSVLPLICVFVGLSIIVSFTGTWFSSYNNPICVGVAISGFFLFKRIPVRGSVAKVVLLLSPFMFAVYCISGTIYFPGMPHEFFATVEAAKKWFYGHGMGIPIVMIGTAVFSFAVGVVFALPQHLLSWLFRRPLNLLYTKVDGWFGQMSHSVAAEFNKHR